VEHEELMVSWAFAFFFCLLGWGVPSFASVERVPVSLSHTCVRTFLTPRESWRGTVAADWLRGLYFFFLSGRRVSVAGSL